jgi:hypothetical protein
MEDLDEGRLGRFAPEQLPRLQTAVLAPGQQHAVIAETPQDLLTTAEAREAGKDERQGVLYRQVRVFDHSACCEPNPARGERLAVGALGDLALPPSVHPEA